MVKQWFECFKLKVQMNPRQDFIVAKNVNTLGVITHKV